MLLRSWLNLAVAVLWLLGTPFQAFAAENDEVILDEIVAKVNNEIITLTDLERELKVVRMELADQFREPAQLEEEFQRVQRPLLRNLIESKLMLQKAEELGLGANIDVDVNAFIEETRRQNNIPSMDVFDQILRQRGSSLNEYRETIKRHMIRESLIGQLVYSKLTLLTPEIEAFYQKNLHRFTEPAEVELAEIVFLTEGKDRATVRERAGEVRARLQAGADFAELARQFSEGPTAARGGNIGKFRQGSLSDVLENVVFELEEGQLSEILEPDYGLQIVKVVSREEPRVKALEEVRPQIQQFLYAQKAEPELEQFVRNLREQSYVYIAPKYREQFDVDDL